MESRVFSVRHKVGLHIWYDFWTRMLFHSIFEPLIVYSWMWMEAKWPIWPVHGHISHETRKQWKNNQGSPRRLETASEGEPCFTIDSPTRMTLQPAWTSTRTGLITHDFNCFDFSTATIKQQQCRTIGVALEPTSCMMSTSSFVKIPDSPATNIPLSFAWKHTWMRNIFYLTNCMFSTEILIPTSSPGLLSIIRVVFCKSTSKVSRFRLLIPTIWSSTPSSARTLANSCSSCTCNGHLNSF